MIKSLKKKKKKKKKKTNTKTKNKISLHKTQLNVAFICIHLGQKEVSGGERM